MPRTQIVAAMDANVLVLSGASDILIALASEMVFTPVWSDLIMDEASRNVRRLTGRAGPVRRLDLMKSRFPLASVNTMPELVAKMTNDEKDRHVLATAVSAKAEFIVTNNLADFPMAACQPHGVKPISLNQFFAHLMLTRRSEVMIALAEVSGWYKNPPMTVTEIVASLNRLSPPVVALDVLVE